MTVSRCNSFTRDLAISAAVGALGGYFCNDMGVIYGIALSSIFSVANTVAQTLRSWCYKKPTEEAPSKIIGPSPASKAAAPAAPSLTQKTPEENFRIFRESRTKWHEYKRPRVFLIEELSKSKRAENHFGTQIVIANATIFQATAYLIRQEYKPLVLVMTNNQVGGGVREGSDSQEAALCRQSNLMDGLEIIEDRNQYPLPESGGVYAKDVTFFRNDEYQFLSEPFVASVFVAPPSKSGAKMLETLFRVAIQKNYDAIVLGSPLIEDLQAILQNEEFAGRFKAILNLSK